MLSDVPGPQILDQMGKFMPHSQERILRYCENGNEKFNLAIFLPIR